jgi:hypothetical protein
MPQLLYFSGDQPDHLSDLRDNKFDAPAKDRRRRRRLLSQWMMRPSTTSTMLPASQPPWQ